jgi:hypothetical protein
MTAIVGGLPDESRWRQCGLCGRWLTACDVARVAHGRAAWAAFGFLLAPAGMVPSDPPLPPAEGCPVQDNLCELNMRVVHADEVGDARRSAWGWLRWIIRSAKAYLFDAGECGGGDQEVLGREPLGEGGSVLDPGVDKATPFDAGIQALSVRSPSIALCAHQSCRVESGGLRCTGCLF